MSINIHFLKNEFFGGPRDERDNGRVALKTCFRERVCDITAKVVVKGQNAAYRFKSVVRTYIYIFQHKPFFFADKANTLVL